MSFTEKMDALIQEHYCSMPIADLCDLLEVDAVEQVVRRAALLRKATGKPPYLKTYRRVDPRFYTQREVDFLQKNIPTLGFEVVAMRLGRGIRGLRTKYLKLRQRQGLSRRWVRLPEEKTRFIKANWPAMSQQELADATGLTVGQVAGKLHRLRAGGHACLKKETTRSDTSKGARRLGRSLRAAQLSRSSPSNSMHGQRS